MDWSVDALSDVTYHVRSIHNHKGKGGPLWPTETLPSCYLPVYNLSVSKLTVNSTLQFFEPATRHISWVAGWWHHSPTLDSAKPAATTGPFYSYNISSIIRHLFLLKGSYVSTLYCVVFYTLLLEYDLTRAPPCLHCCEHIVFWYIPCACSHTVVGLPDVCVERVPCMTIYLPVYRYIFY